jgi:hypothetical protein
MGRFPDQKWSMHGENRHTLRYQSITTVDLSAVRQPVLCYTDASWIDDAIVARILSPSACSFLYRRPTWWTTTLVPFVSTRKVFVASTPS